MHSSISILEDNKDFASLLAKFITQHSNFIVPNVWYTLQDAINNFNQNPSNICLVDISLPDGSGIDFVKHVKDQFPETLIIMCTSFEDDANLFNSLKAGAVGYIIKTDDPFEITTHIQQAIDGGAPMSSAIALKVVKYFQNIAKPVRLQELSAKENIILQYLSEGLLYKEIALKESISIDTIKKHSSNIYRKLHVSNKTEAINKMKQL
jgi:two-component system, NarL family, response regulator LiaR